MHLVLTRFRCRDTRIGASRDRGLGPSAARRSGQERRCEPLCAVASCWERNRPQRREALKHAKIVDFRASQVAAWAI